MQYTGDRSDITVPITGGASGAVAANRIIIADAANPGSGKLSTAAARGLIGVTLEVTDTNGYAPVRTKGIAKVIVGSGGVTAGDNLASDSTGQAVTIAPTTPGTVKQVAGVALNTAAAGALVDMLIQPMLAFT